MAENEGVFRFKQFQIIQDKNVHRVGTDGVLLGAWADLTNIKNVLDVGTGTGVISLMIAQRLNNKGIIKSLEPDIDAFQIAKKNVETSPFHGIEVINKSLQDFSTENQFDLIICNPPYFEKSLKPPSDKRATQRHNDFLSSEDLISYSKKILKPEGRLCVVLPVIEGNLFKEKASANNLYPAKLCAIFSKEGKPQERWLMEFQHQQIVSPFITILNILDAHGNYTDEYRSITKDFYLNF